MREWVAMNHRSADGMGTLETKPHLLDVSLLIQGNGTHFTIAFYSNAEDSFYRT
jgi:hypothetical protein